MRLRLIGVVALSSSLFFISCSNKASLEQRQKSFEKKLVKLDEIGLKANNFKPNMNKSSFVVKIDDSKKLANYILSLVNLDTLDDKVKDELALSLSNIEKIGVDVDWKKYKENKEDSVYVYLLDSSKYTNKTLKELIQKKQIGAYLTFDNKDNLKRVKANDLNFIDNKTNFITKDLILDIKKSSFNTKEARAYDIKFDKIVIKDNDNSGEFIISNIVCSVDQEDKILGKQDCKIGDIKFEGASRYSKVKSAMELKELSFKTNTYKKEEVINSDGSINLPLALMYSRSQYENYDFVMKNYKFDFKSKGFKYQDIVSLYKTLSENNLTQNQRVSKMFDILSKLYSNKIELSGKSSYDSFDFNGTKYKKPLKLSLTNYKGDFLLTSDKTINYSSNTSYNAKLEGADRRGEYVKITLQDYSDKFAIKDLYNFIPNILDFAKESASKNSSQINPIELQKKFLDIANKTVHNGLGVEFAPKAKSISVNANNKDINIKDLDIALNLKLDKNNIDVSNPLGGLLLIASINGNGHIKLDKNNFDKLIQQANPKTSAIFAKYAKEENGKVIFNLELKGGQLFINGKPLR